MKITLVGMGMGDGDSMTAAAREALAGADVVLGAARLLESLPEVYGRERLALATPDKVAAAIDAHPEWGAVCVALSGDVGFYSGARQLLKLLERHRPEVICGVSTVQYFAARLRRPWQDFHLVSAHGVECDILAEVLNHPEVMFLTGGTATTADIVRTLCEAGLDDATVSVGENLSYSDENIVVDAAGRLAGRTFASLSVVLVENRKTFRRDAVAAGIADDDFVRGKAPMTKREVRAAALALLEPTRNAILYDVGAGTGSVAVEMALLARRGRVYAVERDAENCRLIESNRERFGAYNIRVIEGLAPGALADLPAPDAVFIGGSAGALDGVMRAVLKKNPAARLVVSAVTLETLAAAVDGMKGLALPNIEVTQIAATRAVVRGGYHMLNALNPVFLIGGGGPDGR